MATEYSEAGPKSEPLLGCEAGPLGARFLFSRPCASIRLPSLGLRPQADQILPYLFVGAVFRRIVPFVMGHSLPLSHQSRGGLHGRVPDRQHVVDDEILGDTQQLLDKGRAVAGAHGAYPMAAKSE